MRHFVGMCFTSDKISICIVNVHGVLVNSTVVDADAAVEFLLYQNLDYEKVGLEDHRDYIMPLCKLRAAALPVTVIRTHPMRPGETPDRDKPSTAKDIAHLLRMRYRESTPEDLLVRTRIVGMPVAREYAYAVLESFLTDKEYGQLNDEGWEELMNRMVDALVSAGILETEGP